MRLISTCDRVSEDESVKTRGRDTTYISETIEDQPADGGYAPRRVANGCVAGQGKFLGALEPRGVTNLGTCYPRGENRCEQSQQTVPRGYVSQH